MAPETSPEAQMYRIRRLEQDVHDLQVKLENYSALQQQLQSVVHDCDRLESDFGSLRKSLYTAALSVGGSAIIFGVSIAVAILQ